MRKIIPEKHGEKSSSMEMPKEYYPSFHIGTDHLPESKAWKVGGIYFIKLKVKQTGYSMHKGRDGKEYGGADFDIVGIEVGGDMKKETKRYT